MATAQASCRHLGAGRGRLRPGSRRYIGILAAASLRNGRHPPSQSSVPSVPEHATTKATPVPEHGDETPEDTSSSNRDHVPDIYIMKSRETYHIYSNCRALQNTAFQRSRLCGHCMNHAVKKGQD